MEKTIWRGSFAEAEERDDLFWAGQTAQQRLACLLELRYMLYQDTDLKMEKVALKRSLHDQED